MTNPTRFLSLAGLTSALFVGLALWMPTRAQDAAKPGQPESIAAIDGLYQKELVNIERRRLERLAGLAVKQTGEKSNQTYEIYFRAAIAANLFAEAEPVAQRVLRSKDASSKVTLMADLVKIMAEVGRGAYEESLATLSSAILSQAERARVAQVEAPVHALPVADRLMLLDAYFQRLTQGDQFGIARKAFGLIRDRSGDPSLKAFAASRLARLDLVGKPAPPIAGTDLDGRPVRLDDAKGNVVLVVFWASWCLNNAEEIPRLDAIYDAYRDRGLRIIGINLDSLQEGGKSAEAVRPAVRQFQMEYNVRWPNLINGTGDQDYARAFAVSEVPANVLIGRDGTVIHLDLARSNLEKVIARAVGR